MDLIDKLNKGFMKPFQVYDGSIPHAVPAMRKDGRAFAGGDIVLAQRLGALQSKDEEKIDGWGNNYFDLADLCLCFEDLVKLQPNSPLLTGIRGVVNTQNGLFIAVDADAVKVAVTQDGWIYFKAQLSGLETVEYTKEGKQCSEKAENLVLLPYDGISFKLNPNQFKAVKAEGLKRKDMICDRDMKKDEIVNRGKVIHPAYKRLYSAGLLLPLVDKVFEYAGKKWDYNTNMGLFLPNESSDNAEGRALYAGRLGGWSGLDCGVVLGNGISRSVGVALGYAEGGAQKFR